MYKYVYIRQKTVQFKAGLAGIQKVICMMFVKEYYSSVCRLAWLCVMYDRARKAIYYVLVIKCKYSSIANWPKKYVSSSDM
jgi:hypothetical protein